ncbi:MAG: hypothetical protein ACI94Y_004120 [Maribacter sp.]
MVQKGEVKTDSYLFAIPKGNEFNNLSSYAYSFSF